MTSPRLLSLSGDDAVIFALQNEASAVAFFGQDLLQQRCCDALKRLYKKLAIKLHPDKNGHTEAGKAFQILQSMFEVTLTAFTAAPPPAVHSTSSQPRPPSSAAGAPPPPPASFKQSYSPPPAPPKTQPQAASSKPRSTHPPPPPFPNASKAAAPPPPPPSSATTFEYDDIPLPPDVFGDVAWDDDWTNQTCKTTTTGTTAKPPPPPPPPPPPAPMFAASSPPPMFAQAEKPSASYASQSSKKATGAHCQLPVPSLDSDEDDDRGVASDSSDDMEAVLAKRYTAAKKRRQQQEAAAAAREEREKKRISTVKSLHQLFAEFGIMDDDKDDGSILGQDGVVGVQVTGQRRGGGVASPTSAAFTPTSSAPQSTRVASGRRSTPSAPTVNLDLRTAACPVCASEIALAAPGLVSTAIYCAQCQKYVVPLTAMNQQTLRSATGRGNTCSCGKAKKGHCFLCE